MIVKTMTEKTATGNLLTLRAASLKSLEKISKDNLNRDDLPGGFATNLTITVITTDGVDTISETFDSRVTVAHDSEKSSSSAVTASELLAYLLKKMNAVTREAILRDMPSDFEVNGKSLDVTEEEVEAASLTLKALNKTSKIKARGAVRCDLS